MTRNFGNVLSPFDVDDDRHEHRRVTGTSPRLDTHLQSAVSDSVVVLLQPDARHSDDSVPSKRSSKSCNSRQTETGDRSTNSSRAQFLAPESPNDVFFQHAQNDSILLSEMSGDEGDESEGGELTDYSSSTGMDSSYTDASVSSSSMSSYATNSSVGTSNSKQSKREKKLRYQGPPATSLLPPRDEASDDEDRPGYPMPYMMSAMRRAANVL